jgi:hypothetical protein
MAKNIDKVRRLLAEVIPSMPEQQDKCACGRALEGALQ